MAEATIPQAPATALQQAILACWDYGYRQTKEIAERCRCSARAVTHAKRKYGLPLQAHRPPNLTGEALAAWFWSRARRQPNGCLEWQGRCTTGGYGAFDLTRTCQVQAHRFAYEQVHGRIPEGLHCLHSCDNPRCVDPAHLRAGTPADNAADREVRGRNAATKIPPAEFPAIRRRLARGETQRAIAADYGVAQSRISAIRRGVRL